MASTITITCPECDKQLKAPSDAVGKKIRCKGCGATFAARETKSAAQAKGSEKPPAKGAKPAPKPAKKQDDDNDETPFGLTEEYLGRRCPECANALGEDDRICLHCGYDTVVRTKARLRKVQHITGLDITLWLLPGILCAIVVFAILGALGYYLFAIDETTFGDEWYSLIGKRGIKVWPSVMSMFFVWSLGRFAVRRLILHPMPPEIELKASTSAK